jgi:hypothetical protein
MLDKISAQKESTGSFRVWVVFCHMVFWAHARYPPATGFSLPGGFFIDKQFRK